MPILADLRRSELHLKWHFLHAKKAGWLMPDSTLQKYDVSMILQSAVRKKQGASMTTSSRLLKSVLEMLSGTNEWAFGEKIGCCRE